MADRMIVLPSTTPGKDLTIYLVDDLTYLLIRNKPEDEQREFLENLIKNGYCTF